MHWPTHQVTNQPPPLADINLFDSDPALVAAVRRESADGTGKYDGRADADRQAALQTSLSQQLRSISLDRLEASLAAHLKAINATLDPHEQLDCMVVTTEAWTVDNDLVTPTLKVKRNRIEDMFAVNFERWSGAGREVVWHER